MDAFNKLKEFRTLLIDDDELIRDSLGMAFTNKGCYLRTAETAEEGLRALRDESFDVIISDFNLPGMDGLEFFRLASWSYPNTVNVLITAYGDNEIAAKSSEIGVHEFVEKPFTVNRLMASRLPGINLNSPRFFMYSEESWLITPSLSRKAVFLSIFFLKAGLFIPRQ